MQESAKMRHQSISDQLEMAEGDFESIKSKLKVENEFARDIDAHLDVL